MLITNQLHIHNKRKEEGVITCLPKESVLAVELIRPAKGEEELAPIIIRASVSHSHQTTAHELESRVELILIEEN